MNGHYKVVMANEETLMKYMSINRAMQAVVACTGDLPTHGSPTYTRPGSHRPQYYNLYFSVLHLVRPIKEINTTCSDPTSFSGCH